MKIESKMPLNHRLDFIHRSQRHILTNSEVKIIF